VSVEIKLCGLRTPDAIAAAARHRATHIGLMFYKPSPRAIDFDLAQGLVVGAASTLVCVGVFVDPEDDLLETAIAAAKLQVVQLHGSESLDRVIDIRRRFGLPVWKAQGVRTSADVAGARHYETVADLLLFDAKSDGKLPGGTGIRFDWRLLEGLRLACPWGVSGGLDADTVAEAVRSLRPSLVDVSSGIEAAPGVKSIDKIAAFCQAARTA
jgi:phosphoribosylanthranilate isomerase